MSDAIRGGPHRVFALVIALSPVWGLGACVSNSAAILAKLERIERRQAQMELSLSELRRASGLGPVAVRPAAPGTIVAADLSGAPAKGPDGAQVVLIEYSDFQCPFCRVFAQETLPRIEREYIETGRARLVFRHLPITSLHSEALVAANAGECANLQGRFWDLHDRMFQSTRDLNRAGLLRTARELGFEMGDFEACLDGRGTIRVRRDMNSARSLGITGTPGFVVGVLLANNDLRITGRLSGARPFEEFRVALDAAVEEASVVHAPKGGR